MKTSEFTLMMRMCYLIGLCMVIVWTSCNGREWPEYEQTLLSLSDSIRYVAPEAAGTGDGLSAANAADFLDDKFWDEVQASLRDQPVTVRFVAGNYERAYHSPLRIENKGHAVNSLMLEGCAGETVFTAVEIEGVTKSYLIDIRNSQNIVVRNFSFTGNGRINYVLSVRSDPGNVTERIRIENCSWKDMRGVIYGATGARLEGTRYVTYINCAFRRIGINAGSHMIYNAYSAKHISVVDCYFEDCPGDYIRFRDKCDYGLVKGCTFYHPQYIPNVRFINMPLYNDGTPFPGNEEFASNYAFFNNSFSSVYLNSYGIGFFHRGYSPPHLNYLLTPAEGDRLEYGTPAEKKALLDSNFAIYTDSIRIYNNTFSKVYTEVYLASYPEFGSPSLGWSGRGEITGILNQSAVPFLWEDEYNF